MATTGNSSRRKASKRPAAATEPTANGLVQGSDLSSPATKKSKTAESNKVKIKKENEGNMIIIFSFNQRSVVRQCMCIRVKVTFPYIF